MQWLRQSREGLPDHQKKFCVLLYCPEMERVALEMCALSEGKLRPGEIDWKTFEDGFPNLFIKNVDSIRGRHVVFLASFLQHTSLLSQLAVIYALPRYLVKSLIVVLPYFPTGTMERVDSEGQIATAHTLATMLSVTPLSSSGPTRLIIYDIHALQERFYFGGKVVPLLVSAIPTFVAKLHKDHPNEEVAIAFPDEGAHKRFSSQFASWETIICTKVREGDKRIVSIKEGDVAGKHVFIVDDLVKTGGTLIQCKEALLKKGAAEVSAFVTHPVFPQESWRRFTNPKEGERPFKVFYITNSCPEVAEALHGKAPFCMISLASSLVDNTLRY
ncbi:Ribose-phosphate pyrophosphokinase 4 [Balamuthia mandrillaris]